MFGTRHLNFAETIHIIQHLPNDLFFFSSRLFDSRMSSSNDCFTGESPGIGRDGSHLYTGGPRMCIGEGQVQAGLLGGGGRDFSEDFTHGEGGALKVVAARGVVVKEGCCECMHGRVRDRRWIKALDRSASSRTSAAKPPVTIMDLSTSSASGIAMFVFTCFASNCWILSSNCCRASRSDAISFRSSAIEA